MKKSFCFSRKIFKQLFTTSIALFLVIGCGGVGSNSGSQSKELNQTTNIGLLDNGSAIETSTNNFKVHRQSQLSGSIGITRGNEAYRGTLTFQVIPAAGNSTTSTPTITTNPSNCELDSTISTKSSCSIVISGNKAAIGNYTVIPTITSSNDNTPKLLNSFMITTLADDAPPSAPFLSMSFPHGYSCDAGENLPVYLTLNIESSDLSGYNVKLASTDDGVGTVHNHGGCFLSSQGYTQCAEDVDCHFPGYFNLIASSNNAIAPITHKHLFVGNAPIVPGNLTIQFESTLKVNSEAFATITLKNAVNVRNLPITITSSNPAIALPVTNCIINSSESGQNFCSISIGSLSTPGAATITATPVAVYQMSPAATTVNVYQYPFYLTMSLPGQVEVRGSVAGSVYLNFYDSAAMTESVSVTFTRSNHLVRVEELAPCVLNQQNESCSFGVISDSTTESSTITANPVYKNNQLPTLSKTITIIEP